MCAFQIEQAAGLLYPGWKNLVPYFVRRMSEVDVPVERLCDVRVIGGYAVFLLGMMSFKEYYSTRSVLEEIHVLSRRLCVICGGVAVAFTSDNLPVCLEHCVSSD